MRNNWLFYLVFLLLISCSQNADKSIKKILTNDSKGKYWDLVYHTDVNGIFHPALVGKDSLPETSLFFGDRQVISYYIYDSNRIIDVNKINGDVVRSYDYHVKEDTLNLNGLNFIVKKISHDSLFLIGASSKKNVRIYRGMNSKRIVLDSLPVLAK